MTTEKSADDAVLDDVFSSGRDRGGNDAPPAAPEAKAPEAEAKPAEQQPAEPKPEAEATDGEPKGYRDPQTGRFVPLAALTTTREKQQAAEKARDEEARLRKEAEDRYAQLERRFAEFERRQQAVQNPPAQPPDPNLDPAGAMEHMRHEFFMQQVRQRLNFSEMRAHDKYGAQAVNEALAAANAAGVINDQWVVNSRDFFNDLMTWHKRQQVLQKVGDDPAAYEKSIEERVRAQVLEELKTGNRAVVPGQVPPAAAPTRFPGTLADATAAGSSGAQPISDEAMMQGVFSTDRKRK